MGDPTRYFYTVAPRRGTVLATHLDLLRACADRTTRLRAHVTVIGPRQVTITAKRHAILNRAVEGRMAFLGTSEVWDTSKGAAVVLAVDAPALRRVWDKPDFPEFSPHLTLYDGPDKDFAVWLADEVDERFEGKSFRLDGVHRLTKAPTAPPTETP